MNIKSIAGYLKLTLFVGMLAGFTGAQADLLFTVNLDTTLLINHVAAPFFVEFQLNDGSGTDHGNNTALLSNFDFGDGSPLGSASLSGGASGDLGSNIVLADENFLNAFIQEFSAGKTLSFDVALTTVIDFGPQPDQFSFAILDCSGVEIPTTGPADALLAVDIDSASPAVRSYGGDVGRSPACGGPPIPLKTPQVVPLPASGILFGLGLFGLGAYGMKRMPRSRDSWPHWLSS